MLELLILLLGAFHAALRNRADLATENLLLRHQLAVLTRPGRKRPPLRARDTLLWVLARRLCTGWHRHLVLVRPDTVVRWHRQAWKLFWRWKSRGPLGRPRLGIETLLTPIRAPRANAIAERVVGTLRRECLDHLIVLNKRHPRSVLDEFVAYYHADRPHRSLALETPEPLARPTAGPIRSRPVLGGLHHVYERVA